jgi:SAM-dependent methyltransferase
MHASSHATMARLVDKHLASRRGDPIRILDVGSMDVNGSYRDLFDDPAWTYVGADMGAGRNVDVVLSGAYDWSALRTADFDVVVSGQAFEHMGYPWLTILDVERVLRPGGLLLLIVPSSGWEHRYPIDAWRYYPDGVRALATWADLITLSAETMWADATFDDDSNAWHDTALVARKPPGDLGGRMKRAALRRVLRMHAMRSPA